MCANEEMWIQLLNTEELTNSSSGDGQHIQQPLPLLRPIWVNPPEVVILEVRSYLKTWYSTFDLLCCSTATAAAAAAFVISIGCCAYDDSENSVFGWLSPIISLNGGYPII